MLITVFQVHLSPLKSLEVKVFKIKKRKHSRSRHHRHGTHCLLTLDNATLYQLLNAILKPTYLLTLNWRHKRLCIRIGHYGAIQMLYYYYYYYYN